MATVRSDRAPAATDVIERFDPLERAVHWTTAACFVILMATGAVLYIGQLEVIVGNREIVRTIHVYTGLFLAVPLIAGVLLRRGRLLRRDLGRLSRFGPGERSWFRPGEARRAIRLGKFNPGQKVNAMFLGSAIFVMLGTGSIMHWFAPFPDDIRTGATFVHDWWAFGIWISVTGHIFLATNDSEALRGMTRGVVTRAWARSKRPRWYAAVVGDPEDQESS
ncbi:MAG: fdnI [Actinomycetia bacterium]|nr:fdnI [Actinomycetes bacterium]